MHAHAVNKPKCFISHATSDADFANAIKDEIERVFANEIYVFCTSSPGAIAPGRDWLLDVEAQLAEAKAMIAVVTPTSLERPWMWFEVGAVWARGRVGDCIVYPLCAAEIEIGALPSPLNRLQALSLAKAADLQILFQRLIDQFGFGSIGQLRSSNITKRIPKYSTVKLSPVDLEERALYSGKYSGYSDDELKEVIDTGVFAPEHRGTIHEILNDDLSREDRVKKGKLVHYHEVDKNLNLPPGTAKRLLVSVAERYHLAPVMEQPNVVRFGPTEPRGRTAGRRRSDS